MWIQKRREIEKDLKDIGIVFDERMSRKLGLHSKGENVIGWYGVLKTIEDGLSVQDRLEEVLTIAKKHDVCLMLTRLDEEKRHWGSTLNPVRVYPNQLTAAFIPHHIFRLELRKNGNVQDAIKRNFLYYQEDARILRFMNALEKVYEQIETFSREAFLPNRILENSKSLRETFVRYQYFFEETAGLQAFVDDDKSRKAAQQCCRAYRFLECFS